MKDWSMHLNNEKTCQCGKIHTCMIDTIQIEEGALKNIPELLKKESYHNICIIEDIHTKKAAGEKVEQQLKEKNIQYNTILLTDEEVIPDETLLGSILIDLPLDCDCILAVGSGTINDICKYLSFQLKIDYIIVATAPSMDGYASNVAPLIVKNLKTTYEVGRPKAIIADLDILVKAPLHMIAAGAGDIIGKYVCLADWKLAHYITGEYYCEQVEQIVRQSLEKVVLAIPNVVNREKEAIASIMEGLILTGIAMSYVGNSRPASGSEHHLSHYWEMFFLQRKEPCALHGTKVGIGTIVALKLYELFHQMLKEKEMLLEHREGQAFDFEEWKSHINEVYGSAAKEVIALEERIHKNSDEEVQKRYQKLKESKEIVIDIIKQLPKAEQIVELLKEMNAPVTPKEIKIDVNVVKNSIIYAKELRNRYGILQLLFDIGMLEELAKIVAKEG